MSTPEQAQPSSPHGSQNLHNTITAEPKFSAVLGFGPIRKGFCCVGIKIGPVHDLTRCGNRISKENRTEARGILKKIKLLNLQADDFGDLLRELADALLCSNHRRDQKKLQVEKWQALIDEAIKKARRDDNTVMGEASDTTGSLLQGQDEIQIRLDRLRVSE